MTGAIAEDAKLIITQRRAQKNTAYRSVLDCPLDHFAGHWVLTDLPRAVDHAINDEALGEE